MHAFLLHYDWDCFESCLTVQDNMYTYDFKIWVQLCLLCTHAFKRFFYLSVRPNTPTLQASNNATSLLKNQNVTLSCLSPNAAGAAVDKYFLCHDAGRCVEAAGGSPIFTVHGTEPSPSGSYQCRAQAQNVNSSLSNKVELHFVGRKHQWTNS